MAADTAAIASGVTLGESLMTRETVDLETPAAAATILSVGVSDAAIICAPWLSHPSC